jgi:hypothetical protein
MELLERGEVAATVHSPVRAESLRHVLDGDPRGVERAGPWVFSSEWLDDLEADVRARIGAADPIDPGVPLPPDPWAPDVVPLLPFERRGSKLYLPGAVPALGAARRMPRLSTSSSRARASARREVEDDELAASWKPAGVSFGSATATPSARTRSRSRRTSS